MIKTLRVLNIEDSASDSTLLFRHLEKAGIEVIGKRVDTAADMKEALESEEWDIILCDFVMPNFDALQALQVLEASNLDTPLIIISGTVGEDVAVGAMRAGAQDYLMKDNLVRLVPAIEGELVDAETRRELRNSETELKASETRLRAIVDTQPACVKLLDAKGNLLEINAAGLAMIEADTLAEAQAIQFTDLILPEYQEAFSTLSKRVFKGESGQLEYEIKGLKGGSRWLETRATPLRNDEGDIKALLGVAVDNSERRHAEEAERFQAHLLDTVEQAVIATDLKGIISNFNSYAEKLYGWTAEEAIGRKVLDVTAPAEIALERAGELIEAISAGKSWTGEFFVHDRGGRMFPVHLSNSPIYDNKGTHIGVLGISFEITEQKAAEEKIRNSERQQRFLAEQLETERWQLTQAQEISKTGSWDRDLLTGFAVWSDESYRIFEASKDEFNNTHDAFLELVHPDDRKMVSDAFAKSIEELSSGSIDHRLLMPDGRIKHIREVWSILANDKGEPVRAIGSSQDITESQIVEEELRKTKEIFDQLANNITDVFWIRSPDMKTLHYISPAYEKLWGHSVGSRYSEPESWIDLVVHEDRRAVQLAYEGLMRDSSSIDIEYRITRKDGEIRWVRTRGFQVRDAKDNLTSLTGIVTDITKRKKAEAELRAKEERFRAVAETASDSIVIIDQESNLLYFNKSTENIFGFKPNELAGQKLTMLMPEYLRRIHEKGFARYLETGKRHLSWESVEVPGLHKDGREIPLDISFSEFFIDGKRHFTGIIRDITDRKASEEAFRESEERLRLLFDQMKDGFYYSTRDGRLLEVNPAMVEMFGYSSREEMLQVDVARDLYFSPEDRASNTRDDKRDGSDTYRMRRKDGTAIWVDDRGQYKYDKDGNIEFHQGILRNVTERKLAEEHLIRSEERYRDLVENAHDIIYSHDLEGNYTSINKAGEIITGYTQEEVLSMNMLDVVAPEDIEKAKDLIAEKMLDEKVSAFELQILSKNGNRITVEINTKLVFYNGVPVGVQGIARDITERKSLEDQLIQAQKLESVGRLAGGIAHDFNNMLTAINGYSDLTLRKLSADDPLRENIVEIKKAGERSALLTNQLLAFSRQQMLMPVVLDINDVITDTITMLRRLIGEDIELVTALGKKSGNVKADPGQLSQILMNLAVNARDAMQNGGKLTIETSNVFFDDDYVKEHFGVLPGAYVALCVSDTGSGMSPETQQRMFEPFFTTKDVGKGTGLGLATVYGIVKQSGGSIRAYSEIGHGTTVKVYLPRVPGNAGAAELREPAREIFSGSETILLVEDEEVVRNLSLKILQSSGFNVLQAENGLAALALFEKDKPEIDLLLTDVVMPQMGGRELAEKLREKIPDLRVLFTSGYTDDAVVRHGILDTGANFIQKPFTLDALLKKVRELLDSPREDARS
ncbi:MAG: PAS domain S-box protein [Pyrinomonadaceae bacterium]